jgi:hypothetical protein
MYDLLLIIALVMCVGCHMCTTVVVLGLYQFRRIVTASSHLDRTIVHILSIIGISSNRRAGVSALCCG